MAGMKLWKYDGKIVMDTPPEIVWLCEECPCDDGGGGPGVRCACGCCTLCMTVVIQATINGTNYFTVTSAHGIDDIYVCIPYDNKGLSASLRLASNRNLTSNSVAMDFLVVKNVIINKGISFNVTEIVEGLPESIASVSRPIMHETGKNHHPRCSEWGTITYSEDGSTFIGILGEKQVITYDLYKNIPDEIGDVWSLSGNATIWAWFGGPADDPYNPIFGTELTLKIGGSNITMVLGLGGWTGSAGGSTYDIKFYTDTVPPVSQLGHYVIYKDGSSREDIVGTKDSMCGGPVGSYGSIEVVES